MANFKVDDIVIGNSDGTNCHYVTGPGSVNKVTEVDGQYIQVQVLLGQPDSSCNGMRFWVRSPAFHLQKPASDFRLGDVVLDKSKYRKGFGRIVKIQNAGSKAHELLVQYDKSHPVCSTYSGFPNSYWCSAKYLETQEAQRISDWGATRPLRAPSELEMARHFARTKLNLNRKETTMERTTLQKLHDLTKSREDRLLEKYQVIDRCGDLTEYGKRIVMRRAFDMVKTALVADLQKVAEADKKDKKGE